VIGARAAKASGDTAPLQMTAVLTTHAKALTSATPGDVVSGAGDVPVFLVTMRGNFVATAASRPPGAAAPAGSYLSIVVGASTFQVLDSGLSLQPATGLARQPRTCHVPRRSPALTDPPHHNPPWRASMRSTH
jgi:hypothetical protein